MTQVPPIYQNPSGLIHIKTEAFSPNSSFKIGTLHTNDNFCELKFYFKRYILGRMRV